MLRKETRPEPTQSHTYMSRESSGRGSDDLDNSKTDIPRLPTPAVRGTGIRKPATTDCSLTAKSQDKTAQPLCTGDRSAGLSDHCHRVVVVHQTQPTRPNVKISFVGTDFLSPTNKVCILARLKDSERDNPTCVLATHTSALEVDTTCLKKVSVKLLRGTFLKSPKHQRHSFAGWGHVQQRTSSPQNGDKSMLKHLFAIERSAFDVTDSKLQESLNRSRAKSNLRSLAEDRRGLSPGLKLQFPNSEQPSAFSAAKPKDRDRLSTSVSASNRDLLIQHKLQTAHQRAKEPDNRTRQYLDSLLALVTTLRKQKTHLLNQTDSVTQAVQAKEEENLKLVSHLGLLERKKTRLKEEQAHRQNLAAEIQRIKTATLALSANPTASQPMPVPGLLERTAMQLSLAFTPEASQDLLRQVRSLENQLAGRNRFKETLQA